MIMRVFGARVALVVTSLLHRKGYIITNYFRIGSLDDGTVAKEEEPSEDAKKKVEAITKQQRDAANPTGKLFFLMLLTR